MAIEGGARWGFDAIWFIDDEKDNNVEIFDRWFHTEPHKHTFKQRVKWILTKVLQSKKRAENLEEFTKKAKESQLPPEHPETQTPEMPCTVYTT